ncbi:hypothetical protein [Acidovorax sp. SUPP3334]|uniref:hypothetical protein n=1 Tax=Acidovorax sp. SUPP3334 TaxID=2920881 RepID=UPI0023DE43C1|nr:hypothetical protein [Acidovorax sp. SUPP3334]GKT21638.1 hypothetical protein AVHM3334_05475 [Acidovorax sp. SUPP3334]
MDVYQLTATTVVIRLTDGASIPSDPDNRDFADYLSWRAAGNEPLPYLPPPAPPVRVPDEVNMGQARLALFDLGKLATVEAALNAMPDPGRTRARIEWDFRPTVRRDSPLVAQLGGALGLDASALDELFIHAATL